MSKIKINDFTVCEGASCLGCENLTTEMLLPILERLDGLGLSAIEAWGGASFEHCIATTYEDPWERLKKIGATLKKTPLQIYFAGQNVLGKQNFPDDTVEFFIRKAVAAGVSIIRIADPLNDTRNLETSLRVARQLGIRVIAGICYAPSAAFNNDIFVMYAKQLERMGAHAISIQDDSGALRPYEAYQLVKALRAALSPETEIQLHTHDCTGMSMQTVLKAAEAGVDVVDTALSPFSMGMSLPSAEAIVTAFADTPYSTELSVEDYRKAGERAAMIRDSLLRDGHFSLEMLMTDSANTVYQIPGGMMKSLIDNLTDARIENKRLEVFEEALTIRAEIGNVPLLSPVADIIAAQAIFNVLSRTNDQPRYSMLTREFKALVHGEYGRTPTDIKPEFRNKICGSVDGMIHRPADRMDPLIEKLRESIAPYTEAEEDVLTFAMFGQKALDFFEVRKIHKYKLDANADFQNKIHAI